VRFLAKIDHCRRLYVLGQEVARKMPDLTITERSVPAAGRGALTTGSGGTAGNSPTFSGIWSLIPLAMGQTPGMALDGAGHHPGDRGPGCPLPGATS
jgi:hypothetical protein